MLPFAGLSYFLQELTGLIAAVAMAVAAYVFFFTNKAVKIRPWLPCGLLVLLLLLPKLAPPLADFLALPVPFNAILGTEVSASLQPLRSPLIPFVIKDVS